VRAWSPSPGRVIKTIVNQLGTASVSEAEGSADAIYNGTITPRGGDVVKNQQESSRGNRLQDEGGARERGTTPPAYW